MTPDHFARVKELLLAVADLSEEERQTYLDDACKDDPELRYEVDAILAHEDDPDGILKTGAMDPGAVVAAEATTVDSSSPTAPDEIAGYRIVRKLGEGGMGVVYEAEQRSPRRPVALKVIRGGGHVDEHRVRLFQREAQALGRLKHPGIAAIYESGGTEAGQHFFAMELVRGVPLDNYLRRHPVDDSGSRDGLRRRLDLFLLVCDAISYAHQRGVIHRDLKPGNILVTSGSSGSRRGSGTDHSQVKILDFGLARMTDADVAVTTMLTEVGKIQGTLSYMSPEQARGNPDEIDIRSDVYALGVLLYEMLTGTLPYDVQRTMIHEAVRVICEEEPAKPSTIERMLRGDLETIALKALEKEPGHRYQSVSALGDDIDRYLTDQPILARPPSATYQLRKLAARHRGQVILVGSMTAVLMALGITLTVFGFMAVLVVILAAFAITMSVMFATQRAVRKRADRERDRAVREAEKANQVSQFVQQMLGSNDPFDANYTAHTPEEMEFARRLLDRAAEKIETELADQPEVLAAIHEVLGVAYKGLGFGEEAKLHLEASLALRRELFGNLHADVATVLEQLGEVSWEYLADYEESKSFFDEALEIRRAVLGEKHPDTATTLAYRGALEWPWSPECCGSTSAPGSLERSERWLREALEIRRETGDMVRAAIADCLGHLGVVYRLRSDFESAISLGRESLAARLAIVGPEHYRFSWDLTFLAESHMAAGDPAAAEPLLRQAHAIRTKRLPEHHKNYVYSKKLLGDCLWDQGKLASADSFYVDALGLYREHFPTGLWTLGLLPTKLAKSRRFQGDDAGADAVVREALAWAREVHGDPSPEVAAALRYLADYHKSNSDEAVAADREALSITRSLRGGDHPEVVTHLIRMAHRLKLRGDRERSDLEAAEAFLGEAEDMLHRLEGDELSWKNQERLCRHWGTLRLAQGRADEAEPILRRGVEVTREHIDEDARRNVWPEAAYGSCLTALGRYEEAQSLLVRGYEFIRERDFRDSGSRYILEWMIDLYDRLGDLTRVWKLEEELRALDAPPKPKESAS